MLYALLASIGLNAQTHVWKAVATGSGNTYAIDDKGALWAWGWNYDGELGIGSKEAKVGTPTRVGEDTDWKFITAGQGRAFFIKNNGTLWAAGEATKGVSGIGDAQKHNVPTQVGTDANWASVATCHFYGFFAYGIKTDGTLWSWGEGETGALGQGTNVGYSTPKQVGTDNDWAQVSCGDSHVLALKKDGTLWAWGANQYKSLSNMGDKVKVPTQFGTENDWASVFAVDYSSYAIKKDGSLWTWGSNIDNVLGLNLDLSEFGENTVPTVQIASKVTAIKEKVVFVTGSEKFRLVGVGDNGKATKVYAWGSNEEGALGDGKGESMFAGNSHTSAVPVEVKLPAGKTIVQLEAGQQYAMALTEDGQLYGWGKNRAGQIGNLVDESTMQFENVPVLVGEPKVEEGVLTFGPDNIPSSSQLAGAKKLVLTGTWGTAEFGKLGAALGNNAGFPPVGNNSLEEVDMSQITVKAKASLFAPVSAFQSAGLFKGCHKLAKVSMPAPEQCANFSSLRDAFWNCEALTSFDLSGCSNVTSLENTFWGDTLLVEVKNLGDCKAVTKTTSAFDKCKSLTSVVLPGGIILDKRVFGSCYALKTIDWSSYNKTTAPKFYDDIFQYVIEDAAAMKAITMIVPDAAFDAFSADPGWSKLNLVKASTTGISSLNATTVKGDNRIYSINGVYVGTSFNGLKAGIYIQNGKKVLVK